MKKFISLVLALIMCFSVFSVVVSATEETSREIASVELHTAKYYAAVKTAEEITDAAFFVDFVVYFDDETSVAYNSEDGWADPTVTADVSWYIQPETDENFGEQQSLYIVIDDETYWAGYVDVEVNQWKAFFRAVVTCNWVEPAVNAKIEFLSSIAEAIRNAFEWIINLFKGEVVL